MGNLEVIRKSMRSVGNKNSNARKVTKYYVALRNGNLDDGGIALVASKILRIEKYLAKWSKKHPGNGQAIMQPEESALALISDLRKRGIIK